MNLLSILHLDLFNSHNTVYYYLYSKDLQINVLVCIMMSIVYLRFAQMSCDCYLAVWFNSIVLRYEQTHWQFWFYTCRYLIKERRCFSLVFNLAEKAPNSYAFNRFATESNLGLSMLISQFKMVNTRRYLRASYVHVLIMIYKGIKYYVEETRIIRNNGNNVQYL